jgi:hypothetical protein
MNAINIIASIAGFRTARDENGKIVSFTKVRQAQVEALAKEYREGVSWHEQEANGNSAYRTDNGMPAAREFYGVGGRSIHNAVEATRRRREEVEAMGESPQEVWNQANKEAKMTAKKARKTEKNMLADKLAAEGRVATQQFVFEYRGKIHRSRAFVRNDKETRDAFLKGLVKWLRDEYGIKQTTTVARRIWTTTKVQRVRA